MMNTSKREKINLIRANLISISREKNLGLAVYSVYQH